MRRNRLGFLSFSRRFDNAHEHSDTDVQTNTGVGVGCDHGLRVAVGVGVSMDLVSRRERENRVSYDNTPIKKSFRMFLCALGSNRLG